MRELSPESRPLARRYSYFMCVILTLLYTSVAATCAWPMMAHSFQSRRATPAPRGGAFPILALAREWPSPGLGLARIAERLSGGEVPARRFAFI